MPLASRARAADYLVAAELHAQLPINSLIFESSLVGGHESINEFIPPQSASGRWYMSINRTTIGVIYYYGNSFEEMRSIGLSPPTTGSYQSCYCTVYQSSRVS